MAPDLLTPSRPAPPKRRAAPELHAEGAAGVPEAVAEDGQDRLILALPRDLIQPNEIIILLLKPSPWLILLGSLRFLIVLVLLATAALAITRMASIYSINNNIVLLASLIALVRLIWQFLDWLSRTYVLTDRRVIRVQGVLRVAVFEAPLQRIQHTEAIYTLRERLFGLGTITFSTAGSGTIDAVWLTIGQPLRVHQQVVDAIRRYGK